VRDAIRSGDISGLAAISVAGTEIESEARALDALAASIRQRHGLPATTS